jgi:hypothetical protein
MEIGISAIVGFLGTVITIFAIGVAVDITKAQSLAQKVLIKADGKDGGHDLAEHKAVD